MPAAGEKIAFRDDDSKGDQMDSSDDGDKPTLEPDHKRLMGQAVSFGTSAAPSSAVASTFAHLRL
ncbi:MAG: hypothetical protein ACREFX_11400, partial [Opitutaceae bacterium]